MVEQHVEFDRGQDGKLVRADAPSHEGNRHIKPGPVIWVTGLSAAGKSTVAHELVRRLWADDIRPVLLDGNATRDALGVAGGFDSGSRRRMGLTYSRLCRMFSLQGHTVVCATISLYHEVHRWNRTNLQNYVEVLLDVPLEELARRDPRGIYASHDQREVVGTGLSAEYPLSPELVIQNFGMVKPTSAAEEIHQFCTSEGRW